MMMKGDETMKPNGLPLSMENEQWIQSMGYFKSARALPDYQLEVTVATGSVIRYDFRGKLNTARFGMLRNEELFQNAHTDGNYLIFYIEGMMSVRITTVEFMDLVLIDRGNKSDPL